MQFRKILVPVDFSPDADRAVEMATSLAKTFKGHLVLLHAYHLPAQLAMPDQVMIPQEYWDGIREAAQRKLDEYREGAAKEGVKADLEIVAQAPSFAIQEAAESSGADLIVMGTRGLTGLKHVLLGSTAERTVRLSPCPVLTVKAAH